MQLFELNWKCSRVAFRTPERFIISMTKSPCNQWTPFIDSILLNEEKNRFLFKHYFLFNELLHLKIIESNRIDSCNTNGLSFICTILNRNIAKAFQNIPVWNASWVYFLQSNSMYVNSKVRELLIYAFRRQHCALHRLSDIRLKCLHMCVCLCVCVVQQYIQLTITCTQNERFRASHRNGDSNKRYADAKNA